MGVELEINEGGEDGDNAERILDVANADKERRLYVNEPVSVAEEV